MRVPRIFTSGILNRLSVLHFIVEIVVEAAEICHDIFLDLSGRLVDQ